MRIAGIVVALLLAGCAAPQTPEQVRLDAIAQRVFMANADLCDKAGIGKTGSCDVATVLNEPAIGNRISLALRMRSSQQHAVHKIYFNPRVLNRLTDAAVAFIVSRSLAYHLLGDYRETHENEFRLDHAGMFLMRRAGFDRDTETRELRFISVNETLRHPSRAARIARIDMQWPDIVRAVEMHSTSAPGLVWPWERSSTSK